MSRPPLVLVPTMAAVAESEAPFRTARRVGNVRVLDRAVIGARAAGPADQMSRDALSGWHCTRRSDVFDLLGCLLTRRLDASRIEQRSRQGGRLWILQPRQAASPLTLIDRQAACLCQGDA